MQPGAPQGLTTFILFLTTFAVQFRLSAPYQKYLSLRTIDPPSARPYYAFVSGGKFFH
jgi:hypothetical protein